MKDSSGFHSHMSANTLVAFEPRKTPTQARASVTVESICEATIQVLLRDGSERLTTTRVAERAGVSVGTLYQYFPNKQSLLFTVFEDHLEKIAQAVEEACARGQRQSQAEIIRQIVEAYVDAKMQRADISIALYRLASDVGGPELIKRMTVRYRKAIENAFLMASDTKAVPDRYAIELMIAAMSGAMRMALDSGTLRSVGRKLREHLVLLCQVYMAAVTKKA